MNHHSLENMLPAAAVWRRYGKTDRTRDRWLKDEQLGFPRPVVIRNRRYFKEAELLYWERAQASKSKAA
jgi:hypothetical protein